MGKKYITIQLFPLVSVGAIEENIDKELRTVLSGYPKATYIKDLIEAEISIDFNKVQVSEIEREEFLRLRAEEKGISLEEAAADIKRMKGNLDNIIKGHKQIKLLDQIISEKGYLTRYAWLEEKAINTINGNDSDDLKRKRKRFLEKKKARNDLILKQKIMNTPVKKEDLIKTLKKNNWNITNTAKELNIKRTNIHHWMNKYQIVRPDK